MKESYYIIKITRSGKSLFHGKKYVGVTEHLDNTPSYYSFAPVDQAVRFSTLEEAKNCLVKNKNDLFNPDALTHLHVESIEILHIVCTEDVESVFHGLHCLEDTTICNPTKLIK